MSSRKHIPALKPATERHFIKRLTELLVIHGWTVPESAKNLGVDRSTVTNIVSGRRSLGEKLAAHMVASLAMAPGVSTREVQELVAAWTMDFHDTLLASTSSTSRDALQKIIQPLLPLLPAENKRSE